MRAIRTEALLATLSLLALAGGLGLAGCSDSSSSKSSEGEGEGESAIAFSVGNFDVSTTEAHDGCVDGALDVLFMPEGAGHPKAFQYPIEIPDPTTLPQAETLRLQDPFKQLEVTFEAAGMNKMKVDNAVNHDVLLSQQQFGDCLADLLINFNVDILDVNDVSADVSIGMSNLRGDRCPQVANNCVITLTLQGQRRQ